MNAQIRQTRQSYEAHFRMIYRLRSYQSFLSSCLFVTAALFTLTFPSMHILHTVVSVGVVRDTPQVVSNGTEFLKSVTVDMPGSLPGSLPRSSGDPSSLAVRSVPVGTPP